MTMAVSQIPSQFWVSLGETPRQQLGLTLLAPAQRSLCFFFSKSIFWWVMMETKMLGGKGAELLHVGRSC